MSTAPFEQSDRVPVLRFDITARRHGSRRKAGTTGCVTGTPRKARYIEPTAVAVDRENTGMTGPLDEQLGFAPDYDCPVPYMQRTRDYYTAIGYTTPYRWAHYIDAPFQPLKKPLARSRVTIVTTAAPYDPAKGDQGPGAAYNGGAKFYAVYDGDTSRQHDLRISHIGYDRKHTSATDSGTWFPLPHLLQAQAAGRVGEVAPRFFGAPTNRSHRVTIETDAPEILARCQADKVDVAVIVPNCPVCHQTSALVARHLEPRPRISLTMFDGIAPRPAIK